MWPVNRELETPELIREFDSLYDGFLKEFPSLAEMRMFCESKAERTNDPAEFNVYVELEHGFYWLRMITRKGDYNLYMHCLSKAALEAQNGSPK